MNKSLVLVYALSLSLTHSLAPPLAPGKLFQFCALVAVCGVDCSTALQERKEEREKEKRGQRERERKSDGETPSDVGPPGLSPHAPIPV